MKLIYAEPALALNNPHLRRPVRQVSGYIEQRAGETRGLRRLGYLGRLAAHRSARGIRRFVSAAGDELTAPQKRTVVELILNVPVALLAFKDVREWASKFPYVLWIVVGLIVVRVAFGIWKRNRVKGVVLQGVAAVQKKLLAIIECTRSAPPKGKIGSGQLEHHVRTSLAAIADIAREGLSAPANVAIHANLMLPTRIVVEDTKGSVPGVAIMAYDEPSATHSWSRVPLGDLGAGKAFQTGRVQVVEDTRDPKWFGAFKESRSRSFACFPVLGNQNEVIAVVNVDASAPKVLTRKNAPRLYEQVLSAPLMLLGQILQAGNAVSSEMSTFAEGDHDEIRSA